MHRLTVKGVSRKQRATVPGKIQDSSSATLFCLAARAADRTKGRSLAIGDVLDNVGRRRNNWTANVTINVGTTMTAPFLPSTIATFRKQKQMAERAIVQLSDEQLRTPLDANTNSIAVIMKHIGGNLRSRWTDFLTTDGEKPWRNRDDEFIDTFKSRDKIMQAWEAGWAALFTALESLHEADLGLEVTIRGEVHSVPLAILRALDHCGYHVGQIVLTARLLVGEKPWQTLTIPRGGSQQFNQRIWKQESR
jgi:uncharacterized damage-inducible protein DinB